MKRIFLFLLIVNLGFTQNLVLAQSIEEHTAESNNEIQADLKETTEEANAQKKNLDVNNNDLKNISENTEESDQESQLKDEKSPSPDEGDEEPDPNQDSAPQKSPQPVNDLWSNVSGFNDLATFDLFSGEFRFKIPISVPAGRNGFTPNLEINYSSLNKNLLTQFGYGMDLNIGAVYRLTNQGTDKIYDKINNYEFGVKILGNYEEIVLIDAEKGVYMDKFGRSFTKYYFDQSNNSWSAEDTAGNRYYFGQSLNTRQYSPNDQNKVFLWQIEKIVDRNGDKIEFNYFYDHEFNQIYPKTIKYGFYPVNGEINNQTNLYEISFDYFERTGGIISYTTAFKVRTNYLLKNIFVKYRKSSGELVSFKQYDFTYDNINDLISKLIKVEEKAENVSDLSPLELEYYTGSSAINLLKKIKNNRGGEIEMIYWPSTFYVDDETGEHNNLPFVVQTLREIYYRDMITNSAMHNVIDYNGGHYFFDNKNVYGSREYAGFNKVKVVNDEGFKSRYFFHQSEFAKDNKKNVKLGEHDDHISKKGRLFRQEIYNHDNKLTGLNLNKWVKEDLNDGGSGKKHYFVHLKTSISADFNPDDFSSNKYKAGSYEYDNKTGNLIKETNLGEVTINLNPESGEIYETLSDIGTDKLISVKSYAEPIGGLNNFVSQIHKTILYKSDITDENKLREELIFFDDLGAYKINKGNVTKTQAWLKTDYGEVNNSGNKIKLLPKVQYITLNENKYDSSNLCGNFGIPNKIIDTNGNATNFEYDEFCFFPKKIIYPTTISKFTKLPISHIEKFEYDYRNGQVIKAVDQNNITFKKEFDALGRPVKEFVPRNAGENFVLKTEIVYKDNLTKELLPIYKLTKVRDRDDLNETDINAWHLSYEYYDGFGKVLQSKIEDTNDKWITNSISYDSRGNQFKATYPYFDANSNFAPVNWNEQVYVKNYYDENNRIIKIEKYTSNNKFFSSNLTLYLPWHSIYFDGLGKKKEFSYDAYNRLIKLTEYNAYDENGNATNNPETKYFTFYDYDLLGNLIKITDQEGSAMSTFFVNCSRFYVSSSSIQC